MDYNQKGGQIRNVSFKTKLIYGRNNDLPPYLRDGCKSEIYSPRNGNRFHIATSSFINGEEGLNEHGLAVAMTFVMTDLKKIKAGFNSCFIVRYLLEKADNTEQAVSLLMNLWKCRLLYDIGYAIIYSISKAIRQTRRNHFKR